MISLNFTTKVNEQKARTILEEIAKDSMGGWYSLPKHYDMEEFGRIKEAAKEIQESSEYLVCIGI